MAWEDDETKKEIKQKSIIKRNKKKKERQAN